MVRQANWITGFLVAALSLLASPAFAQFQINDVIVNGSGCRTGSFNVLQPTGSDFVVLEFKGYNLKTTEDAPVGVASCNFAMALEVDDGTTVSITTALSVGAMALEDDATSTLSRQFFFTGDAGERNATKFDARTNFFQERDDIQGVTLSGCDARQGIARVNTSLAVTGVGSAAVNALLLRFKLGSC